MDKGTQGGTCGQGYPGRSILKEIAKMYLELLELLLQLLLELLLLMLLQWLPRAW